MAVLNPIVNFILCLFWCMREWIIHYLFVCLFFTRNDGKYMICVVQYVKLTVLRNSFIARADASPYAPVGLLD